MISQIHREHAKVCRQIRACGLPVARRSEHPVEEDERRLAGTAEITMEEKIYHESTKHTKSSPCNARNFFVYFVCFVVHLL